MWQSHLIKPDSKLQLSDISADVPKNFDGDKASAEACFEELKKRLDNLQELLYAEGKHKFLIVLQAMDTAGKDGTIRSVFSGINPQGVDVVRFKAPTLEELSHDFLWRVHKRTPEKGMITIFNRSHYEDVVIVKVHKLVSDQIIQHRYGHINEFERMLSNEGVMVLKFFFHISKEEQKMRLQDRLNDPKKHWKFALGDLHERKSWAKYMAAYEQAIERTSTSYAPWLIVPANKKWYRNLVVAQCIVDHLEHLKMHYPKMSIDPKTIYFK